MSFRFKKVYVEITSSCNLACSFCPPTQRPAAFLTVDQFRHIAAQIAPLTDHVHFHVKGEPLLHPRLPELLGVAAEFRLRVHIVTNGTLIAKVGPALVGHRALHQVSFSLHSERPQAISVADYFTPIAEYARKAAALGTVVALRFWRHPEPELLAAVEAEFAWMAPEVRVREGKGFRVAEAIFVHFEREFVWPSLEGHLRSLWGYCLGLRDQIAILVDGTVVPCCLDSEGVMALGNVFSDDLTPILASPRAQAIYRGFTERRCVEPLCQRCGFRSR